MMSCSTLGRPYWEDRGQVTLRRDFSIAVFVRYRGYDVADCLFGFIFKLSPYRGRNRTGQSFIYFKSGELFCVVGLLLHHDIFPRRAFKSIAVSVSAAVTVLFQLPISSTFKCLKLFTTRLPGVSFRPTAYAGGVDVNPTLTRGGSHLDCHLVWKLASWVHISTLILQSLEDVVGEKEKYNLLNNFISKLGRIR